MSTNAKANGYYIRQGASYLKVTRDGQRKKMSPKSLARNATSFITQEHATKVAIGMGCKPDLFTIVRVVNGEVVP